MRRWIIATGVALCFLTMAGAALAHTLRLNDGRVLQGDLIKATSDAIWFRAAGSTEEVMYALSEVVSILFTTPPDDATRSTEPVKVGVGTKIRVRLENPLSTNGSNAGDTWFGLVAEDITVGDRVVVPAGKRVTGRVRKVVTPKRDGTRAVIELVLASVPVSGKDTPVITDYLGIERDGKGNMNTTGSAGMDSQSLIPFMDGWNITLPAGSVLAFHLTQPMTIR